MPTLRERQPIRQEVLRRLRRGVGESLPAEIPSTVQSVLAARLDRLAERDKRLLQTASVIGKEFGQELLRSVVGATLSAPDLAAELPAILRQQNFDSLSIAIAHALRAGNLPGPQRDPFDRMPIAQAQAEDLALVSKERVFDAYGVRRIW